MHLFTLEQNKCPICGSTMTRYPDVGFPEVECSNECYCFIDTNGGYSCVYIYEKEFITQDNGFAVLKTKEEIKKSIQAAIDEIKYWRENDRYLMKIMGV